ncbi:hypothetical protein ACMFMG_011439 [Clarireedia jacksonii]
MSSTPFQSPPKTPRRPIMAIVHDKLAERSASKANMTSTPTPLSKLPQRSRTPRLSGSGIQVPATQSSQTSPLKESHTPHADHKTHSISAIDEESELEFPGATPEFEPGDPKAELPLFNWKEFEQRYEIAIRAASDKEDGLLEEFHYLTEAFQIWAESSSERDNDRAWKRLKTRERYVQLSEDKLRDKKKHYVQVVEALKTALKLFE